MFLLPDVVPQTSFSRGENVFGPVVFQSLFTSPRPGVPPLKAHCLFFQILFFFYPVHGAHLFPLSRFAFPLPSPCFLLRVSTPSNGVTPSLSFFFDGCLISGADLFLQTFSFRFRSGFPLFPCSISRSPLLFFWTDPLFHFSKPADPPIPQAECRFVPPTMPMFSFKRFCRLFHFSLFLTPSFSHFFWTSFWALP